MARFAHTSQNIRLRALPTLSNPSTYYPVWVITKEIIICKENVFNTFTWPRYVIKLYDEQEVS